eukprot:UN10110
MAGDIKYEFNLSHLGWPIANDKLYGGKNFDKSGR